MNNDELFREFEFLRERLYKTAQLIAENKNAEAGFILGGLYESLRIRCMQLKPA